MNCPLRILSIGIAVAATSLLLIAANWLTVLVLFSFASFAWGLWSFYAGGCAGVSGGEVTHRSGQSLSEAGAENVSGSRSVAKSASGNNAVNLYRFPAGRLAFSTPLDSSD